jgi:PTH2 family peptidyl-tRNA hydrolase
MTIKQVIVIRKDLKMRRGKEIAQGSHASMSFLISVVEQDEGFTAIEREWVYSGFKKIVVTVNSEEELLELHKKAKEADLRSYIIKDEGHTEFHGIHTYTALAIGPNYSSQIDELTGKLPLY